MAAALVAEQSLGSQALYDTPAALAAYRATVGSQRGGHRVRRTAGGPHHGGRRRGLRDLGVGHDRRRRSWRCSRPDGTPAPTRRPAAPSWSAPPEVGRHAPLLAAVVVSALACVAVALAIGVVATVTGLPARGSFLLGAAVGACGLVFTGVAAVAVQVSESTRSAYGLVGAVLGRRLPAARRRRHRGQRARLGLADRLGAGRAPVLRRPVVAAAALRRRDRRPAGRRGGACSTTATSAPGCCPAGPGAPAAGPPARLPAGPGGAAAAGGAARPGRSAWRCSARSTAAWATRSRRLFEDNPAGAGLLPGDVLGAGLVDAYLATIFSIQALLAAAYAVSSVLRARTEEAAGRAEPVLATATGRTAWLGSHVTVALLGSAAAGRRVRGRPPRWSGRDDDRRRRVVRPAVRRRRWPTCRPCGWSRDSPWRRSARFPGRRPGWPGACSAYVVVVTPVRDGAELAGLGRRPVAVRLDAARAGSSRGRLRPRSGWARSRSGCSPSASAPSGAAT